MRAWPDDECLCSTQHTLKELDLVLSSPTKAGHLDPSQLEHLKIEHLQLGFTSCSIFPPL